MALEASHDVLYKEGGDPLVIMDINSLTITQGFYSLHQCISNQTQM